MRAAPEAITRIIKKREKHIDSLYLTARSIKVKRKLKLPALYLLAPVFAGLSSLWSLPDHQTAAVVNGLVMLAMMILGATKIQLVWR